MVRCATLSGDLLATNRQTTVRSDLSQAILPASRPATVSSLLVPGGHESLVISIQRSHDRVMVEHSAKTTPVGSTAYLRSGTNSTIV